MTGELERRHFLRSVFASALIYPTFSCSLRSYQNGLWVNFTEEEEKSIAESEMAKRAVLYAKRKYSCAESIYLCALDYLGKPLEYGSAAMGFGGGMGKDNLCGLLTGGFMAIGVASHMTHQKRDVAYKYNRKRCTEFWNWFEERAPIQCADLAKLYDDEQFDIVAMRVAAHLETLIAPAKETFRSTS